MNQKREKIEALLALSSDLDFENNSISGTVQPVSVDDVALINLFIDRNFGDDFQYVKITPKENEASTFRLNLVRDNRNYASYQSYIEHKFDIAKKINCNENDIVYENLDSVNKDQADYIPELKLFAKFIRCLSDSYYKKDNLLIFFSKNYCEVPVQPRAFEKYLQLAKLYKENNNLTKSLQEFLSWITEQKTEVDTTEPLNSHKNELYVIVATEIIDSLSTVDKNDRIFNLIRNIENIINDTKSKYGLYLDDFKYSKFVDKINKYADEFLAKVNKVIVDLQTQVLAIPLAVSVITIFKDTNKVNDFIYFIFFIYLVMVFYSSCQQAYNLKHIKIQIKQFDSVAKLPKELSSKWEDEIVPVNRKIICHTVYLVVLSFFIGGLAGFCIINMDALDGFYLHINYLVFFTILLFISLGFKLYEFIDKRKKQKNKKSPDM
ncbi:MAG: hypothetical protein KAZ18_01115 [Acinetobacter sp.]|nr:hypothetical protein [Acinetobacter sp.]